VVLVDCLTLWASNLMLAEADAETAIAALLDAIGRVEGRLVLVTNEVGMGIVPDNAMARRFRDLAGMLNQRVAAAVETVDLAVSGLTIRMKG
jgi:adenosylcobinamide kinase/adenosylcobinamide-phosphate guanylyltransferase